MKVLLDNVVSWRVGRSLREAGHDVVHVADLAMTQAEDGDIYAKAASDGRVLVTQDSDFIAIHEMARVRTGVVFMRLSDGRPARQAEILRGLLSRLESELVSGAFVLVEDGVFRVRLGNGPR